MPQIRLDLMRKLVALHSLNIVHRDIKPENILYSPMRKSVVFGDFGMNLIIKENCSSQTFTTFAGTPNFCSPEMRKLLNGEQGYVNLYLNDYHSLKETFNCLENNIIK
jgi:serine/threonine protein kinase